MRERMKTKGRITVRVFGPDGNIKRKKPGMVRKLLKLPGKAMESVHHNIITSRGDALLADWVSRRNSRSFVDGTNGYIEVGTGWSGNSPKNNTGCNTPTGSRRILDENYPKVQADYGSSNDNIVNYRATFTAGSLNASGIDETALLNSSSGGDCLAYAQITPEVNVTTNDSLQILWEITFLGT